MTEKEKAKAYDEALKKASAAHKDEDRHLKATLERIFPELKEDDDERIKKELIQWIDEFPDTIWRDYYKKDIIDWIEKQGEQKKQVHFPKFTFDDILALQCCMVTVKNVQEDNELYEQLNLIHNKMYDAYKIGKQGETSPILSNSLNTGKNEQKTADKVEPKFKVGDWIISSVLGTARIIGVNDSNEYQLEYIDSKQKFSSIDYVNYAYDKWTIQDAKDGDIIRLGTVTAIFKKYISQEKCICYCSFCKDGGFEIPIENGEDNVYGCYNATPVTKEQCDSFMKVMNDAGYEWDIKKKELNKKKKFNPKTLKPFDKVLVRDKSCYNWMCELFSYIKTESEFKYWCISNGYKYCIPYNDDTKHLVGTTEEAPEYYRYWED